MNGARRAQRVWRTVLATTLAAGLAILAVVPVYLVLVSSLKDRDQIVRNPLGLPNPVAWENFPQAWEVGRFGRYFVNSLLVTTPTVLAVLALSLLAAYAFALLRFRGKDVLFTFFLVGMTIPLSVLSIPLFYEMLDFGLLDTHWALILPQVGISMPFGILLLRSFIQTLPGEILDAGRIDGCSTLGLLRYVVVPLTRPALLSLLIFNFTWSWNEFLLAVVLLQTEAARTLPLGLNFFRGQYSTDYPLLMAGATITFIPILIVYILFQRQFIKGIAAGALNGV